MQVNSTTSPNFGQLRISKSPELTKALRSQKKETLLSIKEAGEKLKDTKFFDLKIAGVATGLSCAIFSAKEAFFAPFESEKFGRIKNGRDKNVLMFGNLYGVAKTSYDDKTSQYNVWDVTNNVVNDVEALTNIALELDKVAVAKYNEEIAAKTAQNLYQKEVDALSDEILNDFGE